MTLPQVQVLAFARNLMERTDPATAGLWPRATALLARQALEAALDDLWRVRAPGMEHCPMKAQLLCLPHYLGDEQHAERVAYAWAGLSRGCHQHPYELPPTSPELSGCIQVVEELLNRIAAMVRPDAR